MSPVEPSRGRGHHAGRAALVSLVGVIVLFATLGLVTFALKDRNSGDLRIGDPTFGGGRTTRLAKEIAEGGPILYGDVSGRKDRDMILQHVGDDPGSGWYAFLASPIDKPRDCTWDWREDEDLFRALCDESLTAPADGEGLPQFKVTVNDGKLDVDLNADARATTTSTTGPTS